MAYAAAHPDVEAGVAKAGLIWAPWKPIENEEVAKVIGLIELSEISAAMIHQIIYGIEKDPLMNDDMVRIGREVLGKD